MTTMLLSSNVLALLIYLPLRDSMNMLYKRTIERRQEVKADEYAIKYGYGKDLAVALKKMENWVSKRRSQREGVFAKAQREIDEAISEHPPTKQRVETLLRKSKELERVVASKNLNKIKDFVVRVFKNNG